jgi:hypothetical protein
LGDGEDVKDKDGVFDSRDFFELSQRITYTPARGCSTFGQENGYSTALGFEPMQAKW